MEATDTEAVAQMSEEQDPERFVIELSRECYGLTPQLRKFHSESNHVYVLDFGGARADRIIKFSRSAPLGQRERRHLQEESHPSI